MTISNQSKCLFYIAFNFDIEVYKLFDDITEVEPRDKTRKIGKGEPIYGFTFEDLEILINNIRR